MSTPKPDDQQSTWRISNELRAQLLAALGSDDSTRARMTYDEFLAWADEDTLAEWVDGEVVLMPSPASTRHQRLTRFLVRVMSSYAELHDLGEVFEPPFQMRLEQSGREPDVLFIAQRHLDRLKDTYLDGPADIAVEIISPESVGRDRGNKFFEYQKAGIPEYWLLEPETERAEFYRLDSKGVYQLVAPGEDGIFRSSVLAGFWLRERWLWQEPLPNVDDVLYEVAGDAYAEYQIARLRKRGYLSGDRSE